MTTRNSFVRLWIMPVALITITLAGLIGALLGEILPWKAFAWLALSTPLLVVAHVMRPRKASSRNR